MSLLNRLNIEILERGSDDPICEVLHRVKVRAYELQCTQGLLVEEALRRSLEEVLTSMEDGTARDHLVSKYLPKLRRLTEEQLRQLLEAYRGLPPQQRVHEIVKKYGDRVDLNVLKRVAREFR